MGNITTLVPEFVGNMAIIGWVTKIIDQLVTICTMGK